MKHLRHLAIVGLLLAATCAHAQFQIKGGTFNHLRAGGAPVDPDGDPPAVTPQFAGLASTAASSAAVSGAVLSAHYHRYPSGRLVEGVTVIQAIVLTRSSFGGAFASGVPRYSHGDEILRPVLAASGSGSVDPSYWRAMPVAYGEVITQPDGTQVTPRPNPNAPGAAPADTYYFSPHANKVFAHRPGRVSIMWVTRIPVEVDGSMEFQFKEEIFDVSSGTNSPVRKIYWTERTFNGPKVSIPTGRIVTVNPVYSTFFPQNVAQEYQAIGYVPPDPEASPPPELRTLWFENTAGLGQLRAYNHEGRVFVEYLGALTGSGGSIHEFLGADIVEVKQVAKPTEVTVKLGEEILPHNATGKVPANAGLLLPSAVLNLAQEGITYYGTGSMPDGRLIHHAEWENDNPDKVIFYWLERSDAGIHFHAPPNLEIPWPRYLNKYLQVWPQSISEYAGVTVEDHGSTTDTGVQFQSGNIPEVVFQDDGAQSEVSIDLATQRLVVAFGDNSDKTNRTLLKFSNGSGVWYQRLFIQSHTVLGSPFMADPDGPGPLTETPAIHTLADLDADGIRDLSPAGGVSANNILVGQRIVPPGDTYEMAGYIAAGNAYHPSAYINPFLAGMQSAAAGAIIPVNAIPGSNELMIWWFRKIEPPDAGFEAFHVPSKSGRYLVSYPIGADRIILASNEGSGILDPVISAGEIYVQNNPAKPGYNPNEEHALMLAGRAYAIRDDLNITSGASYTSKPFVLVSYINPADSRPALQVFEVLRESADFQFDYPVTAGTGVPSPMPLPLLPLPLRPDGTVPNAEVLELAQDPAPDRTGSNTAPLRYDRFTYQDRKGCTKVYRGPHDGGTPTMAMRFYYPMRNGFFIPGLASQPVEGTVLPYLRPLSGGVPQGDPVTGTPLTITYRPAWPDAVPELRIGETLTLPKFGLPQVRGQSSARVLYEQSVAIKGSGNPSVVLHDSTRAKSVALAAIPTSIATTGYQGRTYFQRLAPHLQQRVYATSGSNPQLIFLGEFVDEIAGEDYLHLNVLSAEDVAALKGLAEVTDVDKAAWDDTIDALSTTVETFIENPAQKGSYIVGGSVVVDGTSLAEIHASDAAVDSYAMTSTGAAAGYVSLLFADGEAFTPQGDPVTISVIKVVPELYKGDMKVDFPGNPLDEQVSLRHSGDFAARPDDYEFDWRYAPGGEIPPVYEYGAPQAVLNNGTTWTLVRNPGTAWQTTTSVGVPRTLMIYDANHPDGDSPGVLMQSQTPVDFSAGLPGDIIFSADLSNSLDGLVLYINGIVALGFRAPEPFENTAPSSGLSAGGLPGQFRLSTNYFSKGLNTISVALYSTADPLFTSSVNFRLEAVTKEDRVDPDAYPSSPWLKPGGTLLNQITIGGSPTAPLGDPLLVMQDNSFTLRYRPKLGSGGVLTEGAAVQDDIEWSEWLDPKLVPGWVKRVLDAINPYNQRMTDLFNNAVNTDVSVITQAGTRWEGDIALNLDNVNDAGLIEIYETILNRAKLFSIDNGYDLPGTNDALLLAAGYLNDLYVVLGNEAYADAANPTISLDDQQTVTEVSSSRFSFEGQVATVMEEELALLRGRDDFLSTSVNIAPAYNRLYWNYTNGIDSGEVLYAVNYNIKEKAGSSTANGIIDAADAQRMFPQSHGDAYGHYLTALTGYYKLLTNPHFTWIPRSETVLVLGQNVAVDYFDERKFAGAAADLARSAEQILGLTCRQTYQDDKSAGWGHFRDNQVNSQTGVRRQWGVDEWTSRATQGAYFHWVNGNAMLPDVDTDPTHTGIRKVDRGTVPELGLLAASGDSFQTLIDRANAFLNPLGLSPDAIAFDISPAELKAGNSHFEQIHQRALTSVLNAKGSFDQAGRMTRLLRNQENQIDEFNTAIEDGERAFNYKLIDLYGSPYPGDVGPGKTYGQGYDGPDLANWFVVDRPSGLVDTSGPLGIEARVLVNLPDFTGLDLMEINDSATGGTDIAVRTIHLSPSPFAQFSEDWFPGTDTGQRRVTGQLQQALTNAQLAYIAVQAANASLENEYLAFDRKLMLMRELIRYHQNISSERSDSMEKQRVLSSAALSLEVTAGLAKMAYESTKETSDATADAFPKMAGFSNDFSGFLRWSVKAVSFVIGKTFKIAALNADKAAKGMEALKKVEEIRLANMLAQLGFSYEEQQAAYELEMQFEEMTDGYYEIARLSLQLQKATEEVRTLIACGDRLQLEREIFRKRAATLVQGYRTRDVAFRTFRNEALEQYRTLFDLAGRYTYLAAKSYDYETGLLGTAQGRGIFNRIVASRALGDLSGGVPQATTSTLGDAGLAGTMAQLAADFSVAEGRLGINNPDSNGTLFSLRHELFRILNDPDSTEDDEAWQQTLEQHIVSDLMADPDAATHCRNLRKPDGSRVPGIIIPFTSTIRHGYNWFGLPLAGGDHNFSPSNFATKIYAAGMVMDGYVGMDPYAIGTPGAGSPASGDADALAATPYVYLIPTGTDYMLAPAFGDTGVVRAWNVADQALPLPYNLGATDFNDTGLFDANGTLSEQPWILRKHQAFRPVNDPAFFYSLIPQEFSSSRLVGRSVWNGGWKIVIPAYSLLDDEQEGLNRFVRSVDDIRIFLRTYSNSGN